MTRGPLYGARAASIGKMRLGCKKPVDASGGHTYMRLQQADAAFDEGLAFVSRLF